MPLTTNKSIPGYPILEVNHPRATARIALHGAHLLEWTPAGKAPVIYLSPQAVYHAGQAIRGGIPVCWPWFGPHPSNPDLPSHGFARIHLWELSSWNEEDSGITLTFTLTDSAATLEWWPHAFRLELEMRLGASLHLALRMTNLGSAPCPVSAALHTYFNTADIHQTRVTGLHGVPYHEKIVPPSDHTQKGDITFDREVDRLYASGAPVQIHDAALPRTIIIEGTGSHSTVVWNPWINKSRSLTDLPDEDYLRFLCVETTNAGADARMLLPGTSHTLAMTVQVS